MSSRSEEASIQRPNQEDKDNFGRILCAALDDANMSKAELARLTNVNVSTIKYYCSGKYFPLPERTKAIVDVLGTQEITEAGRIELTCPICKKRFMHGSRKRTRFCSRRCYQTMMRENRIGRDEFQRRGNELRLYHETVALHCLDCTGAERFCRFSDCALRPVSPMPLRQGKEKLNAKLLTSSGPIARVNPNSHGRPALISASRSRTT